MCLKNLVPIIQYKEASLQLGACDMSVNSFAIVSWSSPHEPLKQLQQTEQLESVKRALGYFIVSECQPYLI
jgi:hypothetical protein